MNDGQHKDYYSGKFRHTVDKAGRVSVPMRWIRIEPKAPLLVIRWPLNAPKCLKVLKADYYEKLLDKVEAPQLTNEEEENYIRTVGACSEIQEIDDAGRLALREDLAGSVGIKGQALLVGCVHYFEVWNEDSFNEWFPNATESAAKTAKERGI